MLEADVWDLLIWERADHHHMSSLCYHYFDDCLSEVSVAVVTVDADC
jgi:hypothetical protein